MAPNRMISLFLVFLSYAFTPSCSNNDHLLIPPDDGRYVPMPGFSDELNARIQAFLTETQSLDQRKVATFDCDGTVFGQVPHYLADECVYEYAHFHPDWHPDVLQRMVTESNTSNAYIEDRIRYLAGMTVDEIAGMGVECFQNYYPNKFYPNMHQLIENLKRYDFEIWVISASPEVLYEGFVSTGVGTPETRVIGAKSIVEMGVTTDKIIYPLPQGEGKSETIDTFIKELPLLAAGNSMGDVEMIEAGTDMRMIVNPDDTTPEPDLGGLTLKAYAEANGWEIVHARDVTEPEFPNPSYSGMYGIPTNTAHP